MNKEFQAQVILDEWNGTEKQKNKPFIADQGTKAASLPE